MISVSRMDDGMCGNPKGRDERKCGSDSSPRCEHEVTLPHHTIKLWMHDPERTDGSRNNGAGPKETPKNPLATLCCRTRYPSHRSREHSHCSNSPDRESADIGERGDRGWKRESRENPDKMCPAGHAV